MNENDERDGGDPYFYADQFIEWAQEAADIQIHYL